MKIRNKETGEVIDLAVKADASKPNTPKGPVAEQKARMGKSEERIQERGKIQDSVKKVKEGSGSQKVVGALELAAAPLASLESGISNPALELQKGNINVADLIKQSALGFSLQRQGQYGDIMKNAGYNPLLADSAGLLLNLSPAKVYMGVSKTFGNISKMSDKGLMKAGNKIVYAVDEAKEAVGKKVGEAYSKYSNVGVDGLEFLNGVSDIPKPVMNKLEIAFGKMEDFAQGMTVSKLREFKTYLGKLKPNSFGQAEHGIQESLDIKDLNTGYGNVRNLLKKSLSDSGLEKKVMDHLVDLDDSFSKVMDARRFIKKRVVDPVMNTPSQVGSFSDEVTKSTNPSSRLALSEIKKASSQARGAVNEAMGRIESFERWQAAKRTAATTAKAIAFGGIAGGVGGAILKRIQGQE